MTIFHTQKQISYLSTLICCDIFLQWNDIMDGLNGNQINSLKQNQTNIHKYTFKCAKLMLYNYFCAHKSQMAQVISKSNDVKWKMKHHLDIARHWYFKFKNLITT